MTKNINTSKEDAGHDNGCQEEKKEGLITLFFVTFHPEGEESSDCSPF